MKKEELINENTKLLGRVNSLETSMNELRKNFASVLFWGGLYSKYVSDIPSWEEIFFKVGELSSDAKYTILLNQKTLLEEELREIKQEK